MQIGGRRMRSTGFLGGGNSSILGMFTPDPWGNDPQSDEHIFERGWFNHQLAPKSAHLL